MLMIRFQTCDGCDELSDTVVVTKIGLALCEYCRERLAHNPDYFCDLLESAVDVEEDPMNAI